MTCYEKHNAPSCTWHVVFNRVFNRDGNAPLELDVTGEHPFYTLNRGWTAVASLEPGDVCVSKDGEEMRFVSKVFDPIPVPVYNLEVEDCHTYFVGDENGNSVLVHNQYDVFAPPEGMDEYSALIFKPHPVPDDLLNACKESLKRFEKIRDRVINASSDPGYQGIGLMTKEIKKTQKSTREFDSIQTMFKRIDYLTKGMSEQDRLLFIHAIMMLFDYDVVRHKSEWHNIGRKLP